MGKIQGGLNSNLVILLPKVKGAATISQFRPIALTNFIFKIIPKILTTRLSSIMSILVLHTQCGFVKGRPLLSCVVAASKCVNLLDKKRFCGNMGIFVEFTKAFDTVEWHFLLKVLNQFGFAPQFMS